jgi:ferredoxin-nitrate reductase
MTRGRPCDYSGLSYQLRRGSSGIQWPCTDVSTDGTERLYTDHVFNTDTDYCEDYGHDLLTGATHEKRDFAALGADGRAVLKAAHYVPPIESPNGDYPLRFTTGRTAYQFHTRTKTGRSAALNSAAPGPWVEMCPSDAEKLGIAEGDLVRVESARGRMEAPARISGVRDGVVFAPFHYGDGDLTAANELTVTGWDPVSKQPLFKVTAATRRETRRRRPTSTGPDDDGVGPVDTDVPTTAGSATVSETMGEPV